MNTYHPLRPRVVRITQTILLILASVTFSKATAAELGSAHAGTDVVRRATSIYEPVSSEINKADSPDAIKWLRTSASLQQQLPPPVPTCNTMITAKVVAIDQVQTYNRFGAFNPAGMQYALERERPRTSHPLQPQPPKRESILRLS